MSVYRYGVDKTAGGWRTQERKRPLTGVGSEDHGINGHINNYCFLFHCLLASREDA